MWGRDQGRVEKQFPPHEVEPEGALAYFFATAGEREAFLSKVKKSGDMVVHDLHEGVEDRQLTYACATFGFKGKQYKVEVCYGFGKQDHAEYMFREGNYCCDCNRSIFIRAQCDQTFETLDCGHEITLDEFHLERRSIQ